MAAIAPQNYYKSLQLEQDAHADAIKKSYRNLALKYHPERNTDPDAKDKFKQISEAYQVLSDLKRRAIFDQYGHEGLKRGVPGGDNFEGYEGGYQFNGSGEEVFVEFFGGDNPFADFFGVHGCKTLFGKKFGGLQGMNVANAANSSPKKTSSMEQPLLVSLEDLYNGCFKKINISGSVLDMNTQTTFEVEKILNIDVKKGWKNGTKIVFPFKGNSGPNQLPGDVIFFLETKKHDRFERDGDDLVYEASISLVDALTGTLLTVKTLDERILKIPINETIGPQFTKKITGEGMPNSKNPNQYGDLLIKFSIFYPTQITDEQKLTLKKTFSEGKSK